MVASSPRLKSLLVFLSFFLLLNSLWFYGFVRDGAWAVLAILSGVLYRKVGWMNFLLVTGAFTAVTAFFLFTVPRLGLEDLLYPDPHSRLEARDAQGRPIYLPGAVLTMDQAFGDLSRMVGRESELDRQPRRIVFRTDSLGFRNDKDYAGQPWVLVGDSFIAGNGNSQEEVLDAQLRRLGVRSYNLGWPGSLLDYAANIQKFEGLFGPRFKALLFVFEGNDFLEIERVRAKTWSRIKSGFKEIINPYMRFFRDTDLHRLTYILYASVRRWFRPQTEVTLKKFGTMRTGFYNRYLQVTRREHYVFPISVETALKKVRDRVAHVFFIPVKYRVLSRLAESPSAVPLPNAQWQALRKLTGKLGLPVTDLTPTLVQATQRLWRKEGELTFWPDDTHWNPNGTAAAARAVCLAMPELNCAGRDFPPRP